MALHNQLGKRGEDLAISYLEKKGFVLLDRNIILSRCELDIVVEDKEYIVFVEVKTRSSDRWGDPLDAVDRAKESRIVKAADIYLQTYDTNKKVRFDVVIVVIQGDNCIITHYDDAFTASLY